MDFTKIIKTDNIKDYPRNIQGKFVLKWFSGFKEEKFKIICALKRGTTLYKQISDIIFYVHIRLCNLQCLTALYGNTH